MAQGIPARRKSVRSDRIRCRDGHIRGRRKGKPRIALSVVLLNGNRAIVDRDLICHTGRRAGDWRLEDDFGRGGTGIEHAAEEDRRKQD